MHEPSHLVAFEVAAHALDGVPIKSEVSDVLARIPKASVMAAT
jgi:hypothetical protein